VLGFRGHGLRVRGHGLRITGYGCRLTGYGVGVRVGGFEVSGLGERGSGFTV
jgi:hypothetical protein